MPAARWRLWRDAARCSSHPRGCRYSRQMSYRHLCRCQWDHGTRASERRGGPSRSKLKPRKVNTRSLLESVSTEGFAAACSTTFPKASGLINGLQRCVNDLMENEHRGNLQVADRLLRLVWKTSIQNGFARWRKHCVKNSHRTHTGLSNEEAYIVVISPCYPAASYK